MLCISCLVVLLVRPESAARKLHLHLLAFDHSVCASQSVRAVQLRIPVTEIIPGHSWREQNTWVSCVSVHHD